MGLRVTLCCEVKPIGEAVGKPSPNRANLVAGRRPETERSILGQVEAWVKLRGGPNPLKLKIQGMT